MACGQSFLEVAANPYVTVLGPAESAERRLNLAQSFNSVGAVVVFTLPTEGATGEFGNGSKTLTVMSDSQGLAKAQGLKVNQGGGKLPIHVTASFRSLTARTTLTQFVEVPPGTKVSTRHGGSGKVIAILAVIGAAAAGGAVYATQRSKSGTVVNPPPAGPAAIGITAGNGTIAPPH